MLPDQTIRFDVLCYGTICLENIVRVPYAPTRGATCRYLTNSISPAAKP